MKPTYSISGQSDLQPVDHEQLRRMVAELPYGKD